MVGGRHNPRNYIKALCNVRKVGKHWSSWRVIEEDISVDLWPPYTCAYNHINTCTHMHLPNTHNSQMSFTKHKIVIKS